MCKKHDDAHRLFLFRTDFNRARLLIMFGDMPWQDVAAEIETNAELWPNFGLLNSVQRRMTLARLAQETLIPELFNRVQVQMGRHQRMNEHGVIAFMYDPIQRPPALVGLAAFAHDRQNVHTRETSEVTNKGLSILLANPVANMTDIYSLIVSVRPPPVNGTAPMSNAVITVARDVLKWYATPLCHVENDFLYKKTLDALWVRIEASEHKDELKKRLWEEWTESVGMCCDGHITRLINVLVGFDPEFLPPVSAGELLQQRMAILAGLDIETDERVVRANAIFDELGTPAGERAAWIEAF